MVASTSLSEQHAVVIGGSMAGLLAARVLLNHFGRVTVLERDRIPDQPRPRSGVPQSHHVHILLTQGQRILEQLFPGLEAELEAAGAPQVNWTYDLRWFSIWGWSYQTSSDLNTHPCSRILLEWLIHRRLEQYDHLKFLTSTQAIGLVMNAQNTIVTGVQIQTEQGLDTLKADLVVDASGRNSALPKWLTQLGYAAPTQTMINSFLGYSSRWYQIPEGWEAPWKVMLIHTKPPDHRRSAVLYPVEENRWVVTLAGVGHDYPPIDETDFLHFAQSLRSHEIYNAIQQAQPLSPIYSYRRTDNCWQHYEDLQRFPGHLVAIGDAVCAFNPVYAQGMTVAALGAQTLDQCLSLMVQKQKTSLQGFPSKFHKQLAKMLAVPWLLATSEDLRWCTTVGSTTNWQTRLMHQYLDLVVRASLSRSYVSQTFWEVMHMVKPPKVLFDPRIFLPALGLG
ncbi:NAD(P)/FAD-dependent oxidoreductase [Acaryochloris sp. CCMEE 5410]|uniref:FAD-dependent oxidoreductase n=1 Tax=Acaryochloris sp. CCMEE 5410 TaxID=310037 RepID=UPI000248509D|nr:FAD-dependent monooxygenase [Acaryochloris sp. CCMEE 5410]KAI9134216.1 FAD-dependent monooxygenase [Acaryochloris sp. CCMEE 5410]